MNLNKMQLKWKIFAYLFGFCAILLAMLWLIQTVFLNDMYKFIRMRELRQVISRVEAEIENPDLASMLLRIQEENEIIVSPTRDFVPPQRPRGGDPAAAAGGGDPAAARGGDPSAAGRGGGNPMPGTITEVKEISLQNGQTVSLTFYAFIAPVNATVTTLRYQLYLISAIMLLLAAALAIAIAKRVSKPIEELNQGAQSLAKGEYGARFAGKGFSEIVQLSDTLNSAAIELGRVEGLRRELLANVSHDLRTPLSLIYSYAEMMNDFPGEITSEQTQVIMDETLRLTTLVNDVLDISKLENELETPDCIVYNLTHSILFTTERMGELLKKEGFILNFIYDGEIFVYADESKIERAFYNLLINAINYSGESHVISITQTLTGARHVRISVTDGGWGIAEDELPFIWDRYYKSGKAHKRAVTGTGLGLSIVKKIIEQHGGEYGAISEVSKGSTFWFEIDIDHIK